MKNRTIQSGVFGVFGVLLAVGNAGVASGAVVGQDNFDNVSVGSLPSPAVGTWVDTWYDATAGTGIVTAPSAPNYLDAKTTPTEFLYSVDLAGAPLAPGTSVHAEMRINDREGYGNWALVQDTNTDSIGTGWDYIMRVGTDYQPNGNFDVLAENSAGSLVDTGLNYLPDTWQLWEIDYVVGASSYTLTVGGTSAILGSAFMKIPAATQLELVQINTWWSGGSRTLADDVLVEVIPEPASLSLLGMGALTMLRRRIS